MHVARSVFRLPNELESVTGVTMRVVSERRITGDVSAAPPKGLGSSRGGREHGPSAAAMGMGSGRHGDRGRATPRPCLRPLTSPGRRLRGRIAARASKIQVPAGGERSAKVRKQHTASSPPGHSPGLGLVCRMPGHLKATRCDISSQHKREKHW